MPSTFLNLLEARPIAAQGKKERTSSQISREARPSALTEIWKRRAKWGHTISPIHFTQPSTQLLSEFWSFSREARYTVTRITLFQFADTTSMSVPQFKDFSGARESASSPALTKINVPTAFALRTHKLYHFPPPRVNRRAPPKLARKDLPRQNANSAPAKNPMRNSDTPYICSEQIDVIGNLLPRRWTADDIAACADGDLFR